MSTDVSTTESRNAVQFAAKLLWAALALGFFKILLDFVWLSELAPAAFTNLVLLITFAVTALLIAKISAGKNWARIVFTVLFVLGSLPALPLMLSEFTRSPVSGMLSVVQVALQVWALAILFRKPAANWFSAAEPAAS